MKAMIQIYYYKLRNASSLCVEHTTKDVSKYILQITTLMKGFPKH